jgi:S-formylglutathione hydrolase FrmB
LRRRLAFGAVAAALVAVGFVAARDLRRGYWTTRGAHVERFTLTSRLVHRDLHEVLLVPRGGGRGRPLLVFLHGRGSPADSNLSQPLFDTLHDLGARAPVVFLPDGGDHSYWHDRADGRWGTSVLREAIPGALARSHADSRRLAIGGISMGGFGALDLARLAPSRFCAVGAHSPALWFNGGETPAGAFDDRADFERNDLLELAGQRELIRAPTWIDVGRDDPFARADKTIADELRAHGVNVTFHLVSGGHSGWSSRMPRYLHWYASRLANCSRSR